jgi:ribosomal protein S18 acetylase RimI-like enzyme
MGLSIEEYRPEWEHYFEQFNRAWIEKYFEIETVDEYTFKHVDEVILRPGGQLLFAVLDKKVIGAVSIKKVTEYTMELSKMAVDENYLGIGAGKLLCQKAVERIRELGAKKAQLYTHSSLKPAIDIYRKLGFTEVPIEPGKYKRADVKMEKNF